MSKEPDGELVDITQVMLECANKMMRKTIYDWSKEMSILHGIDIKEGEIPVAVFQKILEMFTEGNVPLEIYLREGGGIALRKVASREGVSQYEPREHHVNLSRRRHIT